MTPSQAKQILKPTRILHEVEATEVRTVLGEAGFKRMIAIERKRTERSNEPFLLMLLEGVNSQNLVRLGKSVDAILGALIPTTRETDIVGWYKKNQAIGVLFTGLSSECRSKFKDIILSRMIEVLRNELADELISQLRITLHFFPDDWGQHDSSGPGSLILYPDLQETANSKQVKLILKRVIDVVGSATLLLVLLPILLTIAAAIKVSSKGSVFFKQPRIGQYGRSFTFLKFRSMLDKNDPRAHQEYVKQLIAGKAERKAENEGGEGVYKLVDDPRITPIGKLLRRSSLDELPQLLNVLRGEMSLVGPRPPIPYELAAYQTWHRRRVLQLKPGITGLWQVNGRNRTSFDDMVRYDLQYSRSWSLWLDFKILLRTPGAVIKGAY